MEQPWVCEEKRLTEGGRGAAVRGREEGHGGPAIYCQVLCLLMSQISFQDENTEWDACEWDGCAENHSYWKFTMNTKLSIHQCQAIQLVPHTECRGHWGCCCSRWQVAALERFSASVTAASFRVLHLNDCTDHRIIFQDVFSYIDGRESEWASIRWFTKGQSPPWLGGAVRGQHPETPSWFPGWMAGTQALGPSLAESLIRDGISGAWISSGYSLWC